MSERFCAHIRIGGRLDRSSIEPFVKAICEAQVSLDWGDAPFEPATAEDLVEVLREGWLWFYDTDARYGEFTSLEGTCRRLGLSYQRHSEAWCSYDAELADWRPGMDKPLVRPCSNEDGDIVFVASNCVKEAIQLLESEHSQQALDLLRDLCRGVPNVPTFEVG